MSKRFQTVLADKGHVEALRYVKVELDGRQLPGAAQGVRDVNINLGAIEDRLALHSCMREVPPLQSLDQ
jgi:hypothetical protein